MKRSQTALILGKVAAGDNRRLDDPNCPGTPILDSWHETIGHLNFSDCQEAVRLHRQRTTEWLQPAHIIAEVKRIRTARLDGTEIPTPNADPNDPVAYRREYAALRASIADGVFDAAVYRAGGLSLTGCQPMAELEGPKGQVPSVSGAFQRPPRPRDVDYMPAKALPPRTVSDAASAALEAERARQLEALGRLTSEPEGVSS